MDCVHVSAPEGHTARLCRRRRGRLPSLRAGAIMARIPICSVRLPSAYVSPAAASRRREPQAC